MGTPIINLLQTGQKTCHDESGVEIPCGGSGQDAEFHRGATWPSPRFDAGRDTVLDLLTGLVWTKNANPAEYPLDWPAALNFVRDMNQREAFGCCDWRLPNRRELRSLISHQARNPALPAGHPFTDVFLGWYWSSTSAAINPAFAWYVHLEGGRVFYGDKSQYYLVWPVRGDGRGALPATGQKDCFGIDGEPVRCEGSGQDGELRMGAAWPEPRFAVDEKEDAILDRLTGLFWSQSADLTGGPVSWAGALASVADLEQGQGHGWRLPNINELESLADLSHHSPALPMNHPFTGVQDIYWSSTTSMFEPDWAWALYLNKGAVGVGRKGYARFNVWAVRDPIG
jgi:hypothetical protein